MLHFKKIVFMLRLRNLIGLGIILLGGFLVYYLFIKSYDYQITFNAKTSPGTIFYAIRDWEETLERRKEITIIGSEGKHFSHIDQNLKIGDSIVSWNWRLKSVNDSVSNIRVRIKDLENSVATRVKNIFKKPPLERILISKVSNFKKGLDDHLKTYDVKIIGEDTIPKKFYAYMEIKSSLAGKARNMIANNGRIVEWLRQNEFELMGKPTMEVTHWDLERDSITFNFMFPVNEREDLPKDSLMKFKEYPSRMGIKAIYHGGYRTSDRAWFALYEYAQRHQFPVKAAPIEFFYNNPMNGGNKREWKAEVFMPLQ